MIEKLIVFLIQINSWSFAQVDPSLLRRAQKDTAITVLNMDAIYMRPFTQAGKLPIALGGYAEANYQYLNKNGLSEGHQFQMRRLTLFVASKLPYILYCFS